MSAAKRNPESGYAMLLLFAMAAIIAITLYNALPRMAFEAQRDQEELLIQRGEQYKRAIQLYYRKTKRYPAKMEDLDNTNGIRFLRHKYIDPLTGKSEWRLIHIGAGGQLTDSLIKKKDKKKEESVNNFITELAPIGGGPQQNATPSLGQRRRASEMGGQQQPGVPGDSSGFSVDRQGGVPGQAVPYPAAGATLGTNGAIVGQGYQQGALGQGQVFQGQSPQSQSPQAQAQFAGQFAGIAAGLPVNSQTGGVSAAPYSTQPGAQGPGLPPFPQPGSQLPGQVPGQNNNAAADVIRNLLTTPRPGGFPGAQTGNAQGLQIGGGIAGVASTVERSGIKLYNEQDEYNKWEFVYDFSKDRANGAIGVTPPSSNQPGLNGPGLNQNAPPTQTTNTNPFGQTQTPGGAFLGAAPNAPARVFPPGVQQGVYPQPGFPVPVAPQPVMPGTDGSQPVYPAPGAIQPGVPPGVQPGIPPGAQPGAQPGVPQPNLPAIPITPNPNQP